MKIFSQAHFLRHVSMPTLREFTDAHVLGSSLSIDWEAPADGLATQINDAVNALEALLQDAEHAPEASETVECNLHLWHDDLRRVHLLSNELATKEFQLTCAQDPAVRAAFADRDMREQALWIFTFRNKVFRDVELHLAFQAKANGKYWKKHRIPAGLALTKDRDRLELFSREVAQLYAKSGGGKSTHIEVSQHASGDSAQITLYVEGPVTALTHFTDNHFKRMTTRIALETAVVYQQSTGIVESVVKGGAKNHQAVLALFGRYVVGHAIKPEEIEKARYKLNELRDGLLAPVEDLSSIGVDKIRLRRAKFAPRGSTGVTLQIEASAENGQDDAINLARKTLTVQHAFEAEYNMEGASVLVLMRAVGKKTAKHFSFNVYSAGASTIKNLTRQNQLIANAVLKSLNVIDGDEAAA